MSSANPAPASAAAAPVVVPSLRSVYRFDRIFSKAAFFAFFGIVIAVGIRWATLPVDPANPTAELSFEQMAAPWISRFGMAMTGVAALVAVLRYLSIRRRFLHGRTIRGLVEDLEQHKFESTESTSSSYKKKKTWYSHHAVLRYTAGGAERKVRLRLPNSGFVFGLVKGQETDLVVLDSAPTKPLIKAVYINKLR